MATLHTHQTRIVESEFVQSLVLAMTGVNLTSVDATKQSSLAQECLDIFMGFILDYVEKKFGFRDSIRIKTAYETGQDLFTTFPDLKSEYEEAYAAFIEMLEKHIAGLV